MTYLVKTKKLLKMTTTGPEVTHSLHIFCLFRIKKNVDAVIILEGILDTFLSSIQILVQIMISLISLQNGFGSESGYYGTLEKSTIKSCIINLSMVKLMLHATSFIQPL